MSERTEIDGGAGTALAIPEPTALVAAFQTPEQMDTILDRIEAEVRSHHADTSTAKGRKAIASLAYKVAQSKTALDNAGKELTDEQRRAIEVVNAERRKVRDRLDALKAEARAPLDEWEKAEEDRIEGLKARLTNSFGFDPAKHGSEQLRQLIERVEGIAIDESWQEYLPIAAKMKDECLRNMRSLLQDAETREAERAELARLRAEAEARAEEDRKRQAAEEAERAAREQEQRRIEAEKAEAERRTRVEREKQEAAERAAQEAQQAAARQAKEAEERHQRELQEARAREERAAQAERDRIAEEQRAAAEAQEKRERNTRIRNRVRKEIVAALDGIEGGNAAIADALMAGEIAHTRVTL